MTDQRIAEIKARRAMVEIELDRDVFLAAGLAYSIVVNDIPYLLSQLAYLESHIECMKKCDEANEKLYLNLRERLAERYAEIEQLREVQKWIPVSERLPEREDFVLVFSEPMRGSEAEIQRAKGWMCHNQRTDITHWMPLPAAPESAPEDVQRCRICGCTDNNACSGGCYWVEDNLCSQCADREEPITIDCMQCANCDLENDRCRKYGPDPAKAVALCAAAEFSEYAQARVDRE